jgi:hypothetical protein
MIELVDQQPDVTVPPAEYARLLGYPRHHPVEGRARDLAEWAQAWYVEHAQPWIYARQIDDVQLSAGSVEIDGAKFDSQPLADLLTKGGAESVVLAAVSAGPQGEAQARQAWLSHKPDEYYFLEVYGSALVEHLITTAGARLCAWADDRRMAVLPHYSPGYPQWDVVEQRRLFALIERSCRRALPGQLDVLESGMLRPKKSQLAVFGLTRQTDGVRRLSELVPCEHCCLASCQYRRVAYRGSSRFSCGELSRLGPASVEAPDTTAPLTVAAPYAVNAKALRTWAQNRLSLERRDDGTINARFRFDGTTCTNMGRPLSFDYWVQLGPRSLGYPIEQQSCRPAPGDDGHRHMCRYLDDGEPWLKTIDDDRPLAGQRLDDVLVWSRPASSAGCYCDSDSRQHKWGLVLETIHYALAEQESAIGQPNVHEATHS